MCYTIRMSSRLISSRFPNQVSPKYLPNWKASYSRREIEPQNRKFRLNQAQRTHLLQGSSPLSLETLGFRSSSRPQNCSYVQHSTDSEPCTKPRLSSMSSSLPCCPNRHRPLRADIPWARPQTFQIHSPDSSPPVRLADARAMICIHSASEVVQI